MAKLEQHRAAADEICAARQNIAGAYIPKPCSQEEIDQQREAFLQAGNSIEVLPDNFAKNPTYKFDRTGFIRNG